MAGNRLEIKEWPFQKDFEKAVEKIDHFFYRRNSQLLLGEIESARQNRQQSTKRTFFKLKTHVEESHFVKEYEGIQGVQKVTGHRDRMTARILKVYGKITGSFSFKKSNLPSRNEINSKILQTPFGGLEVAYELVGLVTSYTSGIKAQQSEKLMRVYEIEIWKWVWFWTISSHGVKDEGVYDLFDLNGKQIFNGIPTTKISKLISYSQEIDTETIKYLFLWHLLSYITSAQDYILQVEQKEGELDKYFERKEMLDMLMKPLLESIDDIKKARGSITPQDDQVLLVLYPFHKKRIAKTARYFIAERSPSDLAWQMKMVPDHLLFLLTKKLGKEVKARLRGELSLISKKHNTVVSREKEIINKLDIQVKQTEKSNKNRSQGVKNQANRASDSKEEKQENNRFEDSQKTSDQTRVVSLEELIDIPLIIEIFLKRISTRVFSTNIRQLILFGWKELYDLAVQFFFETHQLERATFDSTKTWNQRHKLVTEKLVPIDRVVVENVITMKKKISAGKIQWADCCSVLRQKVGQTVPSLKAFEKEVVSLLKIHILDKDREKGVTDGEELKDYIILDYEYFSTLVTKMTADKVIKDSKQTDLLLVCWRIINDPPKQ